MQEEYSLSKIIKIASLAYSALSLLFFGLLFVGRQFVMRAEEIKEQTGVDYEFSGGEIAVFRIFGILAYVELFGYFIILYLVFRYCVKKSRYNRTRQPWPESEKFPTVFFIISVVFYMIFMVIMR